MCLERWQRYVKTYIKHAVFSSVTKNRFMAHLFCETTILTGGSSHLGRFVLLCFLNVPLWGHSLDKERIFTLSQSACTDKFFLISIDEIRE